VKLAVSNIAWEQKNDEEILRYLADSGYSGLEIAPDRLIPENPYAQTALAKQICQNIKERFGLAICSMQAILYGRREQIFAGAADRMIIFKQVKKAIDFAAKLSCPNLVFGAPKNRVIRDKNQYPLAVEFFYQLGEYARQRATVIAIEANPPIYETNFINKTEEAFKLVKDVGSSGFKVNVDLGTIIYNREKPDQVLAGINYINHVHISEPYLAPLKKRTIHQVFFKEMRDRGYNGYLSIEMKNPGDLQAVLEAVDYIRRVSDAINGG
jgi:sugar phosphate isomerase/epimerase